MKKRLVQILLLLISIWATPLHASHIVGGNIEMKALEKEPGKYLITLRLFQDNFGIEDEKNNIPLFIYRKSNNQQMLNFMVSKTSEQNLTFANFKCARDRNLDILARVYTATIQLNPDDYDDINGYYMFWENCCRNASIDNIIKSSDVGSMFYLQFPALKRGGKPFLNSTPAFEPINGEYLCVNNTSRINFDATDSDGDELRYSLTTPIAGTITIASKLSTTPYSPSGKSSYPLISWESSFSATVPIPGQTKIDAKKGYLTITPNKLGLYAFAVKIEEIRNGEVIGYMIRDFQYLVVDCPPSPVPILDMSIVGFPDNSSPVTICEGRSIGFSVQSNSGYEYQWQRDGDNITGENKNFYVANESGTYDVEVSLKNLCTKTVSSKSVILDVIKSKGKLSPEPSATGCLNGFVTLKAQKGTGNLYTWYKNGVVINGLDPNQDSLRITKVGKYYARIDNLNGCFSRTDTISVNFESKNRQTCLTSSIGRYSFCPNASFEIKADSLDSYQYKWFKGDIMLGNNKPHLLINEVGKYHLEITDIQNGCTYLSDTALVKELTPPFAIITTTGNTNVFCAGDSIELKAINLSKASIQWQKDGVDVGKNVFSYVTQQKGLFSYAIVDSNGCKNISQVFSLDTVSKIIVKLEPLTEMCEDANAIALVGYPMNGTFTGTGVQNDKFNPKISGAGTFVIHYSITSGMKCLQGTAEQTIIVNPLPKPANLPTTLFVNKGSSVVLNSGSKAGYSYKWSPSTYLDADDKGNPVSTPDNNIDYTVKIISDKGCIAEGGIKLNLVAKILIPTAFTPNNDGNNDEWLLFGLENYPESEVFIYNRWGEVVFYSKGYKKPFDGKLTNGIELPSDTYTYRIKAVKPSSEIYELTGSVFILK